ncbi:MAG: Asp-tRNA(Asn)/Glu-tRNA(Gln) amidotransferase subunit GatC [Pseudomonadota bacterium]
MHKTACIIADCPAQGSEIRAFQTPEIPHVSLDKDQVEHIAMLARLSLSDGEFDDVVDKLSRIVDFVDQLSAAPTDDVLPMAHPLDAAQRLRADVVTEQNARDRYQENAADVADGYYLVPKVID